MSIRPVKITDQGIEVVHDERNHGGVVPLAQITFSKTPAGQNDVRYINLPCPVAGCDSVSCHPIGGGAAPREVQRLFVHVFERAGQARAIAFDRVKRMANEMDGPGRFKFASVTDLDAVS